MFWDGNWLDIFLERLKAFNTWQVLANRCRQGCIASRLLAQGHSTLAVESFDSQRGTDSGLDSGAAWCGAASVESSSVEEAATVPANKSTRSQKQNLRCTEATVAPAKQCTYQADILHRLDAYCCMPRNLSSWW